MSAGIKGMCYHIQINVFVFGRCCFGFIYLGVAGEIAQWLRGCTILSGNQGLDPFTHMVAHNQF